MNFSRPAARDPASGRPPSRGKRRKLFDLHGWVGFNLAFLMALVLATGTLATLSHEIDWLLQHDMRVAPDEEMVSWGTMEEAVRAHRPNATILGIEAIAGDRFAYRARVEDEHGEQLFVHVDQWTGAVTGETHPLTVQRFFRDFHRYLFMPGFLGLPIVSSLAFILAISLYTGLGTARNWRTIMTRIRLGRGIRVMIGDAHKAAGIWASWFLLVIIVTGAWYLAEFGADLAGNRLEPAPPVISEQRAAAFGPVIRDRPLDEVVAAARAAFPEQRITAIRFPGAPAAPFAVLGRQANPLLRERANRVFLDPVDLSVIGVQREADIPAAAYLNEMADPLHFGSFGGLATKIVWFLFGLVATGLSITGVWLTWRRLRSRAVSRVQLATLPVLFVALVFFAGWLDRFAGADAPPSEHRLEYRTLPSATVLTAALARNEAGEATGAVRLVARAEGRPNIRQASLCIDDRCATTGVGRSRRALSIPFAFAPSTVRNAARIRAGIEYRDGTRETTGWRLR